MKSSAPIPGTRPLFPLENRPAYCESTPIIEVEQLSLHYGQKPAFHDVTLSINKGCITALVGPSGCGKTSFLTSLNRLTDIIPGCRLSGRIRLDNLDVLAPHTDVIRLRRRVGMIFQKPNPFPLSILKNLEFPCVSMESKNGNRSPPHRDRAARRGAVGGGQGPPAFSGISTVGRPTATIVHGESAGSFARRAPDG